MQFDRAMSASRHKMAAGAEPGVDPDGGSERWEKRGERIEEVASAVSKEAEAILMPSSFGNSVPSLLKCRDGHCVQIFGIATTQIS